MCGKRNITNQLNLLNINVMSSKVYNAQRQGNEAHLHVQDETGKADLKKVNAKEKADHQPAKDKENAKPKKTTRN